MNNYDLTFWASSIQFVYKNYEGKVEDRMVLPTLLYRGTCEWHQGDQWLLDAQDLSKPGCPFRTFAVKDIIRFTDCPEWLVGMIEALLEVDRLGWRTKKGFDRPYPWFQVALGFILGFNTAVLLLSLKGVIGL